MFSTKISKIVGNNYLKRLVHNFRFQPMCRTYDDNTCLFLLDRERFSGTAKSRAYGCDVQRASEFSA